MILKNTNIEHTPVNICMWHADLTDPHTVILRLSISIYMPYAHLYSLLFYYILYPLLILLSSSSSFSWSPSFFSFIKCFLSWCEGLLETLSVQDRMMYPECCSNAVGEQDRSTQGTLQTMIVRVHSGSVGL